MPGEIGIAQHSNIALSAPVRQRHGSNSRYFSPTYPTCALEARGGRTEPPQKSSALTAGLMASGNVTPRRC